MFYFVIQSSFKMEEKDLQSELSSIRNLMERSSKFISLSGLSGIMAGIYALIGAYFAYQVVFQEGMSLSFRKVYLLDYGVMLQLVTIAVAVLIFSIITGIWLTIKQADKKGEKIWNPISKRLLVNMAIPLVTGGLFILILLYKGQFGILASASLLFYGLALISASHFTFTDIKWLGFCEIILGLLALAFQGYGILFWALGFGVLHIIYGSMMHFKYKQ
jgi:hypothetical protein